MRIIGALTLFILIASPSSARDKTCEFYARDKSGFRYHEIDKRTFLEVFEGAGFTGLYLEMPCHRVDPFMSVCGVSKTEDGLTYAIVVLTDGEPVLQMIMFGERDPMPGELLGDPRQVIGFTAHADGDCF